MKNGKEIGILAKVILLLVIWNVHAPVSPSLYLKIMPQATEAAAYAAERPFYEGKTINIIAPSAPGAGYDQYARLLTRHMGKHIPGAPRFVVENMIGGGGLVAANHLYNRVKPDGLTFMVFNHANIVKQLVGDPHVLLDVRKMKWIGTASDNPNICVIRNSARYTKIEDMIGAKEQIVMGATPADTREYVPKFLNEILGTNLKIITGYKSGSPIFVAIESGETDGVCGIGMETVFVERPNWLKDKYASIFLQVNPVEKMPGLPNVPWVMDYVKNPADRQLIEAGLGTQAIAYSFAAPPGVPNDRVEILRKAFAATMKDGELLAEMARMRRTIKPRTGPEIEAFIKKWLSLPKESVDRIRKIYFPAGF